MRLNELSKHVSELYNKFINMQDENENLLPIENTPEEVQESLEDIPTDKDDLESLKFLIGYFGGLSHNFFEQSRDYFEKFRRVGDKSSAYASYKEYLQARINELEENSESK